MFGQTTDKLSVKSQRLFIAAIVLVITGFLFTIIGVCMPFWLAVTDVAHGGVFQSCVWTFKECSSTQNLDIMYKDGNLYQLLWGVSLTGMFVLLLSLVFLCTYPIHKTVDHCKIAMGIFVSVFLVTGVVLILIALIVYVDFYVWLGSSVSEVFDDVGWAWYITLVGLVILVAGFICFILHMFFMVYEENDSVEPASTRSYTNQQSSNRDYYGRSRRY